VDVPLSWHTDLAVLVASGSSVEEHADHLVVRTPSDPTYEWGNFVLVTDPATVNDATRWESAFASDFPDAAHRAIGLPVAPTDVAAWEARGLEVEHEDVLVRDEPLPPQPLPEGYVVRPLSSDADWVQSPASRRAARRRLVDSGNAVFLGAFAGGELAADLGIVDCGAGEARYQDVATRAPHRRRGLASHLLGAASAWAALRGVHTWVILADAGDAPSRLYQGLGFTQVGPSSQAYRPAPRT
jgi:GNAT superfamily N-acetyltransferase